MAAYSEPVYMVNHLVTVGHTGIQCEFTIKLHLDFCLQDELPFLLE